MVAFLIDLDGGSTKFPCHLVLCDNRDTAAHYHRGDGHSGSKYGVEQSLMGATTVSL